MTCACGKHAYYNEIEPYAAQWLRNLISAGYIAPGDVDERDIKDVKADDLRGYVQCHFFAGIGGWSYALRLAGRTDDEPVWTGSCPCQPFSVAGERRGFSDERHLWPAWFNLIAECRPTIVFGEQVASKDGLEWFDLVSADLENAGYAVGAADLCAASVQAPHIRQRLWFVADSVPTGWAEGLQRSRQHKLFPPLPPPCGMGNAASRQWREWQPKTSDGWAGASRGSSTGGNSRLVDTASEQMGFSRCPWESGNTDWILCTDGKSRPVESGTFPLANGIPCRVAKLRALGNAIVPQVAAEFIKACFSLGE
jgi:DNA (cytosine-5)-methyltransferase 1